MESRCSIDVNNLKAEDIFIYYFFLREIIKKLRQLADGWMLDDDQDGQKSILVVEHVVLLGAPDSSGGRKSLSTLRKRLFLS